MLQEGFAEVITSKTVKLRVVDALKTGYRNEAAIEGDVLYLQVRRTLCWCPRVAPDRSSRPSPSSGTTTSQTWATMSLSCYKAGAKRMKASFSVQELAECIIVVDLECMTVVTILV